jgi:DNA-binding NtrC family response regulator
VASALAPEIAASPDLVVIDDDPDIAEALAEILQAEGYHVRTGFDGQAGLRLVAEHAPDLVLLDVEMPILDGPGMAHSLLVHNVGLEKIPLVLLSGIPNLRDVARRVGTPYFLGKPYRYNQLTELLSRALSERSPPHPEEVDPPT